MHGVLMMMMKLGLDNKVIQGFKPKDYRSDLEYESLLFSSHNTVELKWL